MFSAFFSIEVKYKPDKKKDKVLFEFNFFGYYCIWLQQLINQSLDLGNEW